MTPNPILSPGDRDAYPNGPRDPVISWATPSQGIQVQGNQWQRVLNLQTRCFGSYGINMNAGVPPNLAGTVFVCSLKYRIVVIRNGIPYYPFLGYLQLNYGSDSLDFRAFADNIGIDVACAAPQQGQTPTAVFFGSVLVYST
jgi:hypothetical protein